MTIIYFVILFIYNIAVLRLQIDHKNLKNYIFYSEHKSCTICLQEKLKGVV